MKVKHYSLVASTILASMGSVSTAASGQESSPQVQGSRGSVAADDVNGSESGLTDIVVTARRRDERLQDVPVAITALSASDITSKAINTQADLTRAAPGLTVRTTQNSNELTFSIRGQSVDAYTGSFPGVLTYMNEVQVPSAAASGFYDIASMQVLKGPQGTLFGRNATGGALLITTAQPTDELEGWVRGSLGNYDLRQVEGAVNVPLSSWAKLRVAFNDKRRDGYVLNLTSNEHLFSEHSDAVRGSLLLEPGDHFRNTTVFEYMRSRSTGAVSGIYDVTPCAAGGLAACIYGPDNVGQFGLPSYAALVAANPSFPAGGLYQRFLEQKERGPFAIRTGNIDLSQRYESYFLSNRAELELGGITLKDIFGFTSQKNYQLDDSDGTDLPILDFLNTSSMAGGLRPYPAVKQFSNEFQVSGDSLNNNLKWIVGLYGSKLTQSRGAFFAVFAFPPFYDGTLVDRFSRTKDSSIAAYAQGTYALSSRLNATAGIRWTREKVTFQYLDTAVSAATPLQTFKDDRPSWTISLDYKPDSDTTIYVAQRGSWRSGGFNNNSFVGLNDFGSETTWDVEGGVKLKRQLGGMPTTLNTAIYYQKVKGTQRLVPRLFPNGQVGSVTANIPGGSRIHGVEVESAVKPATWLELGANYAYTKADYGSPATIVNPDGTSITFGPYADTPLHAGSAYAQVTAPLGVYSTGMLRLDYYGQTKTWFSNTGGTTDPGAFNRGYSVWNMRGELRKIGGRPITLGVTVKNLTNKIFFTGGPPAGAALGYNQNNVAPPRMYWLDLTVDL